MMFNLDHHTLGIWRGRQTLEEFCEAQSAQRDHLDLELQQFSINVREAVMKSCEDTLYNFLHKAGFNVKVRKLFSRLDDKVYRAQHIQQPLFRVNPVESIANNSASLTVVSGFHTGRGEGVAHENNGGGEPVRDIVYRTSSHEDAMPKAGEIHEGEAS